MSSSARDPHPAGLSQDWTSVCVARMFAPRVQSLRDCGRDFGWSVVSSCHLPALGLSVGSRKGTAFQWAALSQVC